MKPIAAALATALWLAWPGLGLAQHDDARYLNLSLASVRYQEAGVPTARPQALGLALGTRLDRHFAIEGRVLAGSSDDTILVAGDRVAVGVEYCFGLYGKGILPLSPGASAYGLLGVSRGKITGTRDSLVFLAGGSGAGASAGASSSDTDVSYGVGADLALGPRTALNIEWARLFAGSGYKVEALSVGFSARY